MDEVKKPLPAKFDKDFACFSKHTKGFGLKMLQKFGFKGRLGKNETGRVNPIIPKVRDSKINKNSRAGLNYKGIDKLSNFDEKIDLENEKLWEEDTTEKRARTARDLINNKHKKQKVDSVIYDFTKDENGEKVEMNRSYFEIKNDGLFPEIRYNLAKTIENIEMKILQNEDSKERVEKEETDFKEQLCANEYKLNSLKKKIIEFNEFLEAITITQNHISELNLFIQNNPDNPSETSTKIESVLSQFKEFNQKHPDEYFALSFPKVLFNSLSPILTTLFEHSNLFQPLPNVSNIFCTLRYLLANTNSFYERICQRTILSRLREVITNEWRPSLTPFLIAFFKNFSPVLPQNSLQSTFSSFVAPKLSEMVGSIGTNKNGLSILLDCLLSWKELVGKEHLEVIFEMLTSKLSALLDKGVFLDDLPLAELSRFKRTLPDEIDVLIRSKVMPQLSSMFADFTVDPANQNFAPFEFILKWQNLLSSHDLILLLEKFFFPKWLTIVHIWTANSREALSTLCGDLIAWYSKWATMFPEKLFKYRRFTENLYAALNLMHAAAIRQEIPPLDSFLINTEKNLKKLEMTPEKKLFFNDKKETTKNDQNSEKKRLFDGIRRANNGMASFKECVGAFAEENNVAFYPLPNGFYNGKQIFFFGRKQIYLDDRCAYLRNGENWRPVSLDVLL